jgi:hypothetical protein
MRTDVLKVFLQQRTHADLAALYNHDMEVQVNVAKEGGRKIDGDYKGSKWIGYTDDINTWKPFRIPWNAATDPKYEDSPMTFDLFKYADGVGMTGWDWKSRLSRWVAFDFDAIAGHSERHEKKLTDQELLQVRDGVTKVPWVNIRLSTSGSGLHLYVFLDPPVPTNTHTEHAALARAILGQMSAESGLDLNANVDACGQNMWVWARKMVGTDGLKLIKAGVPLTRIPENWRDHVDVISGRRKRIVPPFVKEAVGEDYDQIFAELTGQRTRTTLDQDHQKLLAYMQNTEYTSWWDADHHMLVTHTKALKDAHEALKLKGIYETSTPALEKEHNCFCFPMRNGSWVVRRYTPGTAEAPSWDQDRNGWTRCYFNRLPDLATVVKSAGAIEHEKGGYQFEQAELASLAMSKLGVDIKVPTHASTRPVLIKPGKEGKVVVKIPSDESDSPREFEGWLKDKDKKGWTKVVVPKSPPPSENEIGNYDDIVRHLVSETGEDCGWCLKTGGTSMWRTEPLGHITLALEALGLERDEIRTVQGSSVISCWNLVNRPFEPEYPGNREWNRHAAQFKFAPTVERDKLNFPTWTSVLEHCGSGLTPYLQNNSWAVENGITTGGEYLKCWVASCFQKPTEPLPYLFFYSKEQNTGKSIFHEAIELLVTRGAVVRADLALGDTQFNGELAGAVICVIEETDLSKSKSAYNKVKDWVTSKHISIRKMYEQPYSAVNTTHWIQCTNDQNSLKVFPGDTRITMLYVEPLSEDKIIPKGILLPRLMKEAPDFLASLMSLELPPPSERLAIPVIETSDKQDAANMNKSILEQFIEDNCFYEPGCMIPLAEFYERFTQCVDSNYLDQWTKTRIGKELDRNKFPKGRNPKNSQLTIGNISWTKVDSTMNKLVVLNNTLYHEGTPLPKTKAE